MHLKPWIRRPPGRLFHSLSHSKLLLLLRYPVKKRALYGFGMALVLASPIWITMQETPNYINFALSLVTGLLLLLLASQTPA